MRKYILAICVLVIVIVALIFIQHQTQTALREQNDSLRAQLEQIQNDNALLSNSLAQAQSPQSSPDQSRELARLRNQVGLLRQQTNELARRRADNNQSPVQSVPTQNQPEQLSPQDQFQIDQIHRMSALKQLALAMHMYAADNQDQFATNFDQLNNLLGGATNFEGGVTLDSFEFMNTGLTGPGTPDLLIFRAKTPRQNPDGNWIRAYGFADGHVELRSSPDGNFDDFEKQHSPAPPPQ